MNHPPHQTCANCLYWDRNDPEFNDDLGRCLRRAPLPLASPANREPEGRFAVWPQTDCDDWCGEWAPSPVAQGKGGAT